MVGALADADDMSMSGIVYFLWVFSRNWHMSLSLSLSLFSVSFSLAIVACFGSYLAISAFLLVFPIYCALVFPCLVYGFFYCFHCGVQVVLPFFLGSMVCVWGGFESFFTLYSSMFSASFESFSIAELLIHHECRLPLFLDKTKEEESPGFYMYCWSRIVILNISDFMFSFHLNFVCIVDIENVLRSWISMILCSLFTSISWFFVTQL